MDEYIGMIHPFAGNYAPLDWHFCDGCLLQISEYPALYSILGTHYGGDGKQTFALPDLRGRLAIGMGSSPKSDHSYVLGQKGGKIYNTILPSNMPAHSHIVVSTIALNCNTDGAEGGNPVGNEYSLTEGNSYASSSSPESYMAPVVNSTDYTIGATGAGAPYDNRMPTLAMSYIICIRGAFPPRN